jgi:hydrogenase maturation factor
MKPIMSETVTGTFEARLAPPERSKGEREYQAFLRLLPQLLATHQGKYVAVHEGQMIDSDSDDIALVQRVHARVGYVPVHVGLVTDQPLGMRSGGKSLDRDTLPGSQCAG